MEQPKQLSPEVAYYIREADRRSEVIQATNEQEGFTDFVTWATAMDLRKSMSLALHLLAQDKAITEAAQAYEKSRANELTNGTIMVALDALQRAKLFLLLEENGCHLDPYYQNMLSTNLNIHVRQT